VVDVAERVTKVRLVAEVSEFEKGMLAAARATQQVGAEGEKLAQKRQAFEQLGRGLVVTGTALTAVTALSVKAAMDWESAWAGVTKTVDGSDAELAKVEEGLRSLTSVLPASHDEIAAVAEAAGQLGIQTPNVVAFTRTMIDLGETTNLSANDAATAIARFTNIMGTSQDEVSNLGSALVGLGNNYATTESEILEMSMRLAGAGKQIGLSEGDVLGLATALSSVGIEAEAGGSAMSKVMIDIASSVEEGGDRLELFAKTAGVSADTFAQKWKSDPAAALSLFVKGLANAESQGTSTLGVLSELGITEVRMRDALLRSASAADQFSGAMSDGNQAFEENNALTLEAAKRYETVESKLAIAGNAVRDAAIDFGEVFLPAVSGAASALTEFAGFMGDLPDPVQGIIGVLTAAVGVIALTGGAALLAVPKIAEFKIALETLGLSMRTIGLVGGGAILALTALVTVVGSVAAAQAAAEQKAQSYADTLAEGTQKVTRATREAVAESLTADQAFLWLSQGSLADNAETLGLSIATVADAISGNADALDTVNAAIKRGIEEGSKPMKDANLEAYDAAVLLQSGIEGEIGALDKAAEIARMKEEATRDGVEATESSAEAYQTEADAVTDLSSQLSGLIDTINEANGVGQDAVTANARYQSALEGLTDQVEKNGSSLDQATAAGAANAASLADVAGAAQNAASAQYEQDQATMSAEEATQKYVATLTTQRQKFIDAAVAAGYSKDEVVKLADQVFRLPSAKEIKVLAETAEAQQKIDRLVINNSGRRITITADVNYQSAGGFTVTPNAAGGLYEGGIKTFAGGGFEPGIYPHRPGGIHKFAEEYAEGYVSMDPARRTKSYGVWQAIGDRMGFTSQQQSAPIDVSGLMDGMRIRGEISLGDGLSGFIEGQLVRAFPSSGSLRSQLP
jgi:TP901 family phage tail tape measure protein